MNCRSLCICHTLPDPPQNGRVNNNRDKSSTNILWLDFGTFKPEICYNVVTQTIPDPHVKDILPWLSQRVFSPLPMCVHVGIPLMWSPLKFQGGLCLRNIPWFAPRFCLAPCKHWLVPGKQANYYYTTLSKVAPYCWEAKQASANYFCKGQTVNSLGFAGHVVFFAITQLYPCCTNAATADNPGKQWAWLCSSTALFTKPGSGCIWPMGQSLLTSDLIHGNPRESQL